MCSEGPCGAEARAEEEGNPDNSGAELMEAALEELGLARDHLTALEEKVEAYAQHFRFLQLELDEVSQRLKQLERLLKQHSCYTSEQLLEKTARAESSLDQWFQMEGMLTLRQPCKICSTSPATSCDSALWHCKVGFSRATHSQARHWRKSLLGLYVSDATLCMGFCEIAQSVTCLAGAGICGLHFAEPVCMVRCKDLILWVACRQARRCAGDSQTAQG